MPEQAAAAPDQPQDQPQDQPGRRGVDPGKVIAKLTATIGEQAQQLAARDVLIDDYEEALAARDAVIAQLQGELVTASGGTASSARS